MSWLKSKYPGIRYRQHATRKHGVQFDKYWSITYWYEGKTKSEIIGWSSEGVTLEKCISALAEIKTNQRTGTGPNTLAEKKRLLLEAKQAEIVRQKAELEAAEIEKQESVPLSVIFKERYIPFARDNKKSRSCDTEEHLFRNWIEPVIGKKSLKDITVFDCERLKKRMRTGGKSDRTIEYTLAVLRQVFSYAKRFKIFIGENHLLAVSKPKYDNRKQRFLTPEETTVLMDALKSRNHQLYLMALVSLHTGLRAGEIFSLTWGDVNFENGLLMLRDTKNSETRYGFMTETLKAELMTLPQGKPSELVFKDRSGNKIKSISATWDRLVDTLGLNDGVIDRRMKLTFHSLRHSFASNCVSVGVDLFRVQQLLGHKTTKMTLRYAHMRPDDLRDAVRQMESGMREKAEQSNIIPMKRTG